MPTYTTTTKHGLRKLTGSNLVSDVDTGFASLADDIDLIMARADHGPAASLPTSTVGSPGKLGRSYYADDTGTLSFDFGTGWITVRQDTGWVNLTLLNSFTVHFSNTPGYRVLNGVVYLRGEVTRTSTSVSPIFTLPAGARPSQDIVGVATPKPLSGGGGTPPTMVAFTVTSTGTVSPNPNATDLASFYGITFPADQ